MRITERWAQDTMDGVRIYNSVQQYWKAKMRNTDPRNHHVVTLGGLDIDKNPVDEITPLGDSDIYGVIAVRDSITNKRFYLQIHADSISVLIAALEAEESRLNG